MNNNKIEFFADNIDRGIRIDISVTNKSKKTLSDIELRAEAALALLNGIDIKYFNEQIEFSEAEETFMFYLNKYEETIKGIKAWAGFEQE